MGIFDRRPRGPSGPKDFPLTLTNVSIAVVLALVLFQAFGIVFGGPLGLNIKLGPVFVILPLAIASILGVGIVKKMIADQPVTVNDIYAIVVAFVVALLVLFFLRDFVPEVFSVQVIELQSALGF